MMGHFLGDAHRYLCSQFWSTALLCSAQLPIRTLYDWTVCHAHFSTGGVFECDIAHR